MFSIVLLKEAIALENEENLEHAKTNEKSPYGEYLKVVTEGKVRY